MRLSQYPRKVQRLVESVLYGRGHTLPSLRQDIEAHTADDHGALRSGNRVPADLRSYIDKVSHHAYKVTDSDIEGLQQTGYSEDELLEITISAALGPALARLEKGLGLLEPSE